MAPRPKPLMIVGVIVAFIFFFSFLHFPSTSSLAGGIANGASSSIQPIHVSPEMLHGDVIMPKLGNETIKQELGRSSWRLFHTMMARFPEKPTADERDALKSYLHLFARLYPCGECAEHFRALLQTYPPQTSSRDAASQWGCTVHNAVNERLGKELFDCGTIADKYHCGCAEEDEAKKEVGGKEGQTEEEKEASDQDIENLRRKEIKLEKEGLTRGG